MGQRNDSDELAAAWRALASNHNRDGWISIPIARGCPCRVLAARHFPGDEEALLVGFPPVSIPPNLLLPQGRGFSTTRIDLESEGDTCTWLALSRLPAGSLDLFTMMGDDILRMLSNSSGFSDVSLARLFIDRIRAWQEFMRHGNSGILSHEAEIGLFGELVVLGHILEASWDPVDVLAAWQGPIDGLQDFLFYTGAIEVKTTIAVHGFSAIISSLDQLDDSVRPIFLAAVRLSLDGSGITLSDLIGGIHKQVNLDTRATGILNDRLLQAGFLEQLADRYTRRFTHISTRIISVTEGFPRLTRDTVPNGIRTARYEVDLDQVSGNAVTMEEILNQLRSV